MPPIFYLNSLFHIHLWIDFHKTKLNGNIVIKHFFINKVRLNSEFEEGLNMVIFLFKNYLFLEYIFYVKSNLMKTLYECLHYEGTPFS